MITLLNPRNDFLFNRMFGVPANQDLLVHFINAVFAESSAPLIAQAIVVNSEMMPDALDGKRSVLDIRAMTEANVEIDIEIQIKRHHDLARGTLYNWARLFEQQPARGADYDALRQCITINVLDFRYLATQHYHTAYHIRDDRTGTKLTDILEIHFVELPKRVETDTPSSLARWMVFLTSRRRDKLEKIAKEDPVMRKALQTLECLSQDPQVRAEYLIREKGLMTYVTDMKAERREGYERGLKQGLKKGFRQAVREGREEALFSVAEKLAREGMAMTDIARLTGLSPRQIEHLVP